MYLESVHFRKDGSDMYQFVVTITDMNTCRDRETLVEVDCTPLDASFMNGDTEEVFAWKVAVSKGFNLLKEGESLTRVSFLSC